MALDIQVINPDNLTVGILQEVYPLIHDMWSETSGECIRCNSCGVYSGKSDVFGHLPREIYMNTTLSLMEDNLDRISCPSCRSVDIQRLHTYADEIIGIRDRVVRSILGTCYIGRNEQSEAVGYGEVYVNTMEQGYMREIEPHYPRLGIDVFCNRVKSVLGNIPKNVMVFSFLTLLAKYRGPRAFAQFLQTFANTEDFHSHHESMGLMEVARGSSVYRLIKGLGGVDLIESCSDISHYYEASKNYNSSILVLPNCVSVFQRRFTQERTRGILVGI